MLTRSREILLLTFIVTLMLGCWKSDQEQSDAVKGAFSPASISLKEQGDLKELQDKKLTFIDSDGIEWVAPQGTLTDGASVPRIALPISDGRWGQEFLKAAVVHDAYCQKENESRTPDQYQSRSWQSVHRMFYEACIAGGTNPTLAKIMFAAVWLGGPKWGGAEIELQQVSDETLSSGFVGSREWIIKANPSVAEIEADIEKRESLILDFHVLETEILAALDAGDERKANSLLRSQDTLLAIEIENFPDDLMLQSFQGYWYKNQARLSAQLGYDDKMIDELRSSEQAFRTVIEIEPNDPSALNGLGSVAILRGDLDSAERYISTALDISPNYAAARHDLQLVQTMRETQRLEQERRAKQPD